MSYAIIESGGKQFRVSEGKEVRVPLLPLAAGETVDFAPLLLAGDDRVRTGATGSIDGKVRCRVVSHGRAKKVIVFKFKRRKQYSRLKGHRQDFTTLKVEKIEEQAEG